MVGNHSINSERKKPRVPNFVNTLTISISLSADQKFIQMGA